MLNQNGKMTTPLNIAKTTESSVSVFIIPVHQTYQTYLQNSLMDVKFLEFKSIEATNPFSKEFIYTSNSIPSTTYRGTCIGIIITFLQGTCRAII